MLKDLFTICRRISYPFLRIAGWAPPETLAGLRLKPFRSDNSGLCRATAERLTRKMQARGAEFYTSALWDAEITCTVDIWLNVKIRVIIGSYEFTSTAANEPVYPKIANPDVSVPHGRSRQGKILRFASHDVDKIIRKIERTFSRG